MMEGMVGREIVEIVRCWLMRRGRYSGGRSAYYNSILVPCPETGIMKLLRKKRIQYFLCLEEKQKHKRWF
jgi:hypothetical protein